MKATIQLTYQVDLDEAMNGKGDMYNKSVIDNYGFDNSTLEEAYVRMYVYKLINFAIDNLKGASVTSKFSGLGEEVPQLKQSEIAVDDLNDDIVSDLKSTITDLILSNIGIVNIQINKKVLDKMSQFEIDSLPTEFGVLDSDNESIAYIINVKVNGKNDQIIGGF